MCLSLMPSISGGYLFLHVFISFSAYVVHLACHCGICLGRHAMWLLPGWRLKNGCAWYAYARRRRSIYRITLCASAYLSAVRHAYRNAHRSLGLRNGFSSGGLAGERLAPWRYMTWNDLGENTICRERTNSSLPPSLQDAWRGGLSGGRQPFIRPLLFHEALLSARYSACLSPGSGGRHQGAGGAALNTACYLEGHLPPH